MVRQIVWNKRAVQKFEEIIKYLEENASQKSTIKFVKEVNELIDKINKYPEIGRRTKTKKTVRQYKLDKHRNLYYKKSGKKLIIVYIFDTRQSPSSNPYL
jgi:plasmid stabilization system protein ParE